MGPERRGIRRPLALLLVALVVVACDDDKEADPNEPQGEPVLEVDAATAATCMKVTEDLPAEVEELPIIGCEVPHTHEIYATLEYALKDVYPGVEELSSFAQVECLSAFEPFVGISVFDSSLSYTWLVPSLTGWDNEDDRDVLCVLLDRDRKELTGTMRDVAI